MMLPVCFLWHSFISYIGYVAQNDDWMGKDTEATVECLSTNPVIVWKDKGEL